MATIDQILDNSAYTNPVKPIIPGVSSAPGFSPEIKGSENTPRIPAQGVDATSLPGNPKVSNSSTETTATTIKSTTPKKFSYLELYEAMHPNKPETDEQRAQREKKKKRNSIISAIGDGISAMSNLYFTTRYAPNAFNPNLSLSSVTRDRMEKLRKERENNDRAYFDGYMRAAAMDRAADMEEKQYNHALEREKVLDQREDKKEQRAEEKAKRDDLLFQVKLLYQQGKLSEQEYKNAIMEAKADKIQEMIQAKINKMNRTGHGRAGSGSGGKGFAYFGSDGQVLGYAAHKDEAIQLTINNGGVYPVIVTEGNSVSNRQGRTTTTTSSKTPEVKGAKAPNKYANTATIKW